MSDPLEERWQIGSESATIETESGNFIASAQGMTIETYLDDADRRQSEDDLHHRQLERDEAIAHHIVTVHNQWHDEEGRKA